MFEHDYSHSMITGTAMRNKRVAQQNADAADAWQARSAEWEAAYHKQGQNLKLWMDAHANLESQLKAKELELAVSRAHSAGLAAYLDAMRTAAPTCSAMADTGIRTSVAGKTKTVGRIAYDRAHDESLIKAGIKDPQRYRMD